MIWDFQNKVMASKTQIEPDKYLIFTLGEEDFAFEISEVREVLEYRPITRVPHMPDFVLGGINLRGNVLPVIDLRLKLGMGPAERTVDTCIVITDVYLEGELTPVGALVDAIKEVVSIDPDQISQKPDMGTGIKSEYVGAIAQTADAEFVIILDRNVVSHLE